MGRIDQHSIPEKLTRQFRFRIGVQTDVGMRREENQDAFGIARTKNASMFVVADGMGGARGGARASAWAINVIGRAAVDENGLVSEASLARAVERANTVIFEESRSNENYAGMGTTVVVLAFAGSQAITVNVGDSRIYFQRDGKLIQLTRDHTLVQDLVDSGAISPEQAENHPIAHMLTRSLGPAGVIQADIKTLAYPIEQHDRFLLCCDGLYNHVSDEEICETLANNQPDVAAATLIELANRAGGSDNITVQVIEVHDLMSDAVQDEELENGVIELRLSRALKNFDAADYLGDFVEVVEAEEQPPELESPSARKSVPDVASYATSQSAKDAEILNRKRRIDSDSGSAFDSIIFGQPPRVTIELKQSELEQIRALAKSEAKAQADSKAKAAGERERPTVELKKAEVDQVRTPPRTPLSREEPEKAPEKASEPRVEITPPSKSDERRLDEKVEVERSAGKDFILAPDSEDTEVDASDQNKGRGLTSAEVPRAPVDPAVAAEAQEAVIRSFIRPRHVVAVVAATLIAVAIPVGTMLVSKPTVDVAVLPVVEEPVSEPELSEEQMSREERVREMMAAATSETVSGVSESLPVIDGEFGPEPEPEPEHEPEVDGWPAVAVLPESEVAGEDQQQREEELRGREEEEKRVAAEALAARIAAEERATREEAARLEAEAQVRAVAAQKAAEERAQQEELARVAAAEKARRETELAAKKAAEEQARQEAKLAAKKATEEKARLKQELAAKKLAEDKARKETELVAKKAKEEKARLDKELAAKKAADEKARQTRELAAKKVAEEKAHREAILEAKAAVKEKRQGETVARELTAASSLSIPPEPVVKQPEGKPTQEVNWQGEKQQIEQLQAGEKISPESVPAIATSAEVREMIQQKVKLREQIAIIDSKLQSFNVESESEIIQKEKQIEEQLAIVGETIREITRDLERAQRRLTLWRARKEELQSKSPAEMVDAVAVSSVLVKRKKEQHNIASLRYNDAVEIWRENPSDNSSASKMAALGRELKAREIELGEAVRSAVTSSVEQAEFDVSEFGLLLQDLDRRQARLNRQIGINKTAVGSSEQGRMQEQRELLDERRGLLSELETLKSRVSDEDEVEFRRSKVLKRLVN